MNGHEIFEVISFQDTPRQLLLKPTKQDQFKFKMWPGWTFYSLISFVLSGALREKTLNSVFLYKALIEIFITQFEWGWFYLFILVDFFSPALTRISSGLSMCICPLLFAKSKWNAVLCLILWSPCSTARAAELWEHSPLAEMLRRPTGRIFLLLYVQFLFLRCVPRWQQLFLKYI